MNNDYLWNKSGNDPEIERLEELLTEFRYSGDSSASNVIEFPRKATRDYKPWVFSIAASLAIAASALGLWSLVSAGSDAVPENAAQVQPGPAKADVPVFTQPELDTGTTDTAVRPQAALSARLQRASVRIKPRSVGKQRPEKADVAPALTKEERFAYNQLMLALSITSSNLQTVRESIDGAADTDTKER